MSEAGVFKARYSFDYLKIEPLVLQYLEKRGYPSLAVSSLVEDDIRAQLTEEELSWIDTNRLKHCISRALGLAGYEKRSKRGKAWEAVRNWCIRQADVRQKIQNPAWKQVRSDVVEADFIQVDTHPVKNRRSKSLHHTSHNLVLCVFFQVF